MLTVLAGRGGISYDCHCHFVEPLPDNAAGTVDTPTVHAVEMTSSLDSETVCENPLCDVRFQQTGLAISPKRFCCDECKQQASIIKRAARLLSGLSDSRVLEILRTP
jgi:hypothetical protein